MATPLFPWYDKLEQAIAPTEGAANLALVVILAITLVVLLKGSAVHKAAWVVYLVSP